MSSHEKEEEKDIDQRKNRSSGGSRQKFESVDGDMPVCLMDKMMEAMKKRKKQTPTTQHRKAAAAAEMMKEAKVKEEEDKDSNTLIHRYTSHVIVLLHIVHLMMYNHIMAQVSACVRITPYSSSSMVSG